jgi:uncharacterized membrane protein
MDKKIDKMNITLSFLFAFLATLVLIFASWTMNQDTEKLVKTNGDYFNFTIILAIFASIFLIGIITNSIAYLKIRSEDEKKTNGKK